MGKRKEEPAMPMTRAALEQLAAIMGPYSASTAALRDMDAHDGPSEAFVVGASIVVKKYPKETPDAR